MPCEVLWYVGQINTPVICGHIETDGDLQMELTCDCNVYLPLTCDSV